jgi:hypothetical protein
MLSEQIAHAFERRTFSAVPLYSSWQTTAAAFEDFLARRTEAALAPREAVPPVEEDERRANDLL